MIYIIVTIFVLILFVVIFRKKTSKNNKITSSDVSQSQSIKLNEIRESDLPVKLAEVLKDKYKDISIISLGGMGVVASAWDIKNKRKVAIKTVLPDLENDPKAIELFFAECNAIKTMNHPNIVKIYEVGESDVLYYYIMEFLEGETLNRMINRTGKIPLALAVKIGTQVARAVQHCHDNRVIHRDIKPSNIFIIKDGSVKIIDFGIVKMITGDTSINKSTTRIGSPEYGSPEQIQGQKISPKSDIYSLGVCFFYMLSNTMPYKTADLFAKMFDKPRNLKELCPEAPDDLVEIINTCINLDSTKRYTGMQLWQKLKALKI